MKEYIYNHKKYNDNYYKKHSEKLKEKIICDCGGIISGRFNISKHNITKKHQLYLENKEFEIIKKIEQDEKIND